MKWLSDTLTVSIEKHPAPTLTPEQRQLPRFMGSAREKQKQREWLLWTAGTALGLGLLISPFLVRVLPFGMNGRVAALILHADRWTAGAALMQAASPEAWRILLGDLNLVDANQAALKACRAAAAQTNKAQRCTVVVPAP